MRFGVGDGSERTQLTRSNIESNTRPRWSPDGRSIAFLSDRETPAGGTQVWVFARTGGLSRPFMASEALGLLPIGEPWQLTEMKGDVSDFAWSPDSKRLALIANDEAADKPDKNAKEWRRSRRGRS